MVLMHSNQLLLIWLHCSNWLIGGAAVSHRKNQARHRNLTGREQGMAHDRLSFYLGNDPVGTFCGNYPDGLGRVEYTPYRGQGHARLAEALRQGEVVTCWFSRLGKRVLFDVVREEFVLGPPGGTSHWYLELSRLDGNPDA